MEDSLTGGGFGETNQLRAQRQSPSSFGDSGSFGGELILSESRGPIYSPGPSSFGDTSSFGGGGMAFVPEEVE